MLSVLDEQVLEHSKEAVQTIVEILKRCAKVVGDTGEALESIFLTKRLLRLNDVEINGQ